MDKINIYGGIAQHQNKSSTLKRKESKNIEKKTSLFKTTLDNEIGTLTDPEQILESEANDFSQNEVADMLKDIGQQGKRLKQTRTLQDLDLYKKKIKHFLQKVLEDNEKVFVKTIYNTKKKEKVSKLHLSIIDKELMDLTRIFIEEQASVIKIASSIDRIEGILLDLAF